MQNINISCAPIKISCIKVPTPADINKLKTAKIVPNSVIDKVFSSLATDFKSLKKKSPSKSKSKGGSKAARRSGRKTRKLHMTGGNLSDFQKNRIVDMIIILISTTLAAGTIVGSSALIPVIETYFVSVGILPKLCSGAMDYIWGSIGSQVGANSCEMRATQYNAILTSITAVLKSNGIVWALLNPVTLYKQYPTAHSKVKALLFTNNGVLSPAAITATIADTSPTTVKRKSRSRSRSTSRGRTAKKAKTSTPSRSTSRSASRIPVAEEAAPVAEEASPETTKKGRGKKN